MHRNSCGLEFENAVLLCTTVKEYYMENERDGKDGVGSADCYVS